MVRILICCGAGFSSSAMTERVKAEVISKGLSDQMYVEFCPFSISYEKLDQFDIIMACPHLKYGAPKYIAKYNPSIPIYIFPPRMYGNMHAEELLDDAIEVIKGYKEDHRNPWCFPGEESTLKIKRAVSYNHYQQEKK